MRSRLAAAAVMVVMAVAGSTAQTQPKPAEPNAPVPEAAQPAAGGEDGFIVKIRRYVEEKRLIERFTGDDEGLYLRFGGMTTGSGIAAGPGYRRSVFDNRVLVDLSAAVSTKTYKAFDAKARWLRLFGDRLELWSDFRYQDYPQEDYFGLGASSSLDGRTNYAVESTDIAARGLFRVTPWLRTGLTVGYFNPTIDSGTDDQYPSIETRFTDVDAPGLTAQPNFVHTTVSAEIDYRDRRGSPTRGGLYRLSFGTWDDVTLDAYDFHRFDADAGQFFQIYPRHVLAGHVGLSYVNNETGHRVPFYFLPYVGGSDTVRGFREFRFRDENILYLNGEYRWQVLEPLDIALFVDAGEVRADWEDIGLHDLKTSYGVGFRVHTSKRTFVRVDIGTGGREGTRLFFKLGPSF